ncbi:Uncharacterised protein [Klebsiella pneumoniae]|nr:Uncharacterised protein [Klebsiella variicola]VGI65746.1 Uncharacterised protein [Klebsiella pneumoniae]VVK73780.1 Uncharacterised protein [Klebsiella pneumoniae]VVL48792.1 Uncharacterised protein [Klebsiella pneumoniae]
MWERLNLFSLNFSIRQGVNENLPSHPDSFTNCGLVNADGISSFRLSNFVNVFS